MSLRAISFEDSHTHKIIFMHFSGHPPCIFSGDPHVYYFTPPLPWVFFADPSPIFIRISNRIALSNRGREKIADLVLGWNMRTPHTSRSNTVKQLILAYRVLPNLSLLASHFLNLHAKNHGI